MKVAIMQPYFLPYMGYWQLMDVVDCFVVYDNIEYTKKGWINRNYILIDQRKKLFTIPIKKDSDYLNVNNRVLADEAEQSINKIIKQMEMSNRNAPEFDNVMPTVKSIFYYQDNNLFNYIYHSIEMIAKYLGIKTKLMISSQINIDHQHLKSEDKVIAINEKLGAKEYINSAGGIGLYHSKNFSERGINLHFFKSHLQPYQQFDIDFVPALSIIDVMMFNSKSVIQKQMKSFEIIKAGEE